MPFGSLECIFFLNRDAELDHSRFLIWWRGGGRGRAQASAFLKLLQEVLMCSQSVNCAHWVGIELTRSFPLLFHFLGN